MAETAGTLVDTILQRVRDPQGAANSRAFVRDLLGRCQWAVNGRKNIVVATESFTTTPRRLVYPIKALVPSALRITAVRDLGRDVRFVPWTTLAHTNVGWFRELGDRHLAFSLIGRDLLVLYPGVDRAVTLTLVYTLQTNDFINDGVASELPDDDMLVVEDLVEALILTKARDFGPLAEPLKRVDMKLGFAIG